MKNNKLLILGIVFLFFFFLTLLFLLYGNLQTYDSILNQKLDFVRGNFLTKVMIVVTMIMDYRIAIVLFFIFLGILLYSKRFKDSIIVVLGLVGAFFLKSVIKILVHRDRPLEGLIPETGYSFPSGHAIFSAVFFLLIIYMFKDRIKNKTSRYLFVTLNVILSLLIGFSRIYLGVHWMSDVLAGFFIGLSLVFLLLFFGK